MDGGAAMIGFSSGCAFEKLWSVPDYSCGLSLIILAVHLKNRGLSLIILLFKNRGLSLII